MTEPRKQFDFVSWLQLPETHTLASPRKPDLSMPMFNTMWSVTTHMELWGVLEHIQSLMKEAKLEFPNTLWFRGLSKTEYPLLPSLIRSYYKMKRTGPLPRYQRALLEKFLAESREAHEVTKTGQLKQANSQIEHIADMQHYGVPTNLMDWSEDISIPLYFSTKSRSDSKAAIYVLHPYFYNFVRSEIIKQFPNPAGNALQFEVADRNLRTTDACGGGLLPNFSAYFNLTAEWYQDFVVGPEKWIGLDDTFQWRKCDPLTPQGLGNHMSPLLPLAIQVPRNNVRIMRQSGTFLAFNLCELPQAGKDNDQSHGFQHILLDEIQKFYMLSEELHQRIMLKDDSPPYRAMKNRYPFLFKIEIASSAKASLRDVAEALGKREDTVYPELYNIGSRIEREASAL